MVEIQPGEAAPRVVYVGPRYTPTHEAAAKLFPQAELFCLSTFKEVFGWVQQKRADYGVLPVENSSTGAIAETYQLLLDQHYEPLTAHVKVKIVSEIYLPASLNLLAREPVELETIRRLYADYEAQLQCSDFIGSLPAHVEINKTISAEDAAGRLKDPRDACIGCDILERELNLTIVRSGIQDHYRSVTRFVAISAKHRPKDSRSTKTTLAFVIPDKPGMLVEALQLVASENINLATIKIFPIRDSRVFRRDFKDWFVVDVETSDTSRQFRRFTSKQKSRGELILGYKLLGSYPAFEHEESPVRPNNRKEVRGGRVDALLATIAQGESNRVEFKSTLRFDLKHGKVNRDLSKAAAKVIASFMNSAGGVLFIGIGDQKEAIGVENDIGELTKKDEDGFILALNQVVKDMIGPEFCQQVHPQIIDYNNKRVCAVEVERSSKPAWLSGEGPSVFYIRAGNSTHPLDAQEASDYIMRRFS